MQLSVIIPVYKVEHTLDRCVESVLRQDVPGMEVILVDDGSPDECPRMCDAWAAKDSRVKVIHKLNGGLSDARNAGMEVSGGDYITFVDSDDYLCEGIYAAMLREMERTPAIDIMEFSVNCIGWEKEDVAYTSCVYPSARRYWQQTRAWNHAYVWNKIYRRKLFDGVRFPKGRLYEDLWILPAILLQNPVVATSSVTGYNYCANMHGITAVPDSENLRQALSAEQHLAEAMGARWYSCREWHLYMCMLYRQVDIYRMSGEILLRWPFVRFVCWVHKKTKGRGREPRTA